jgi:hypothetical protein
MIMSHRSFHKVVDDPYRTHHLVEVVHLAEVTSDDFRDTMVALLLLLLVVVVVMVLVVDNIVVDMVVNLYE